MKKAMKNNQIIKNLRKAKQDGILTNQQFNTLKGQILSGRTREAVKGFLTIMKSKKRDTERIENN